MTKVLVLILAFAIVGINASVLQSKESRKVGVSVMTKENINKFLEKHPNAVELVKTQKPSETPQAAAYPSLVFEYTLGNRVFGDELVAHDTQFHTWIDPRDIEMTLDYPASGVDGAVVTYVNIRVVQTSSAGRAYVFSGGIGYRYIIIIVEAEHTTQFDHNANIYGKF